MNYDMESEMTLEEMADVDMDIISEAVKRYPLKGAVAGEAIHKPNTASNEPDGVLVIKPHDFELAKSSLKKFSSKESLPELSKVEEKTCFGWLDHDVSGSEFNTLVTQIQGCFKVHNGLIMKVVDEFAEVYKAFEALDKDYIKGIVASINAAAEVSAQEQKDRADIRRLVEGHAKAVQVLKKFKEEIEKVKHITDVDKAWEMISGHAAAIAVLEKHRKGLAGIAHLKDVDGLWDEATKSRSAIASLEKHRKNLDGIAHLKDVDKLWKRMEELQAMPAAVSQKFGAVSKAQEQFAKSVESRLAQQTKGVEDIKGENDALCKQVRVLSRKLAVAIVVAGVGMLMSVSLLMLNLWK